MKRVGIVFLIGISTVLQSADVVLNDDDYFSSDVRNTRIIYTQENLPFAQKTAIIETALNPLYEKSFGYRMDERLDVGLASSKNQIANGFSTQYPNNRQMNYGGGVLMVDYFSTKSWLETLLYHETAHNYQINAKNSKISKGLYKVLGNGSLFMIPWLITPNLFESSFLLEGNSVLNESWHGNGGRLYSGRFKAEMLMQAKAGYITPKRVYNDNLDFLYGSHFYVLGGFFQEFLAQKYGIDTINGYWLEHSGQWYAPFFTNRAMKNATGVEFDENFDAWKQSMESQAREIQETIGETVATSQFYTPLNDDNTEIYFIINESAREMPRLVVYDKQKNILRRDEGSWIAGKVIKTPAQGFATQASSKNSPYESTVGLYDRHGYLLNQTHSKMVEGYMGDGKEFYFDVPLSFDQPKLYVNNELYTTTNSSVFKDSKDNLYYFAQKENKERILYKNKIPLLTLKGFYGHVCGVDSKGAVYFIANSAYGSSLYRWYLNDVTRAISSDTVIDVRLIDDNTALAVSVGSNEYKYQKIALETLKESPFEVSPFFENQQQYSDMYREKKSENNSEMSSVKSYNSLTSLNYSGAHLSFALEEDKGLVYDIQLNFADPLRQNALSLLARKDVDGYGIFGITYENSRFFLPVSLMGYGVFDRPPTEDTPWYNHENNRKVGVIASASLPIVASEYLNVSLDGNFYQDYSSNVREPLSFELSVEQKEQYGVSMYPNFLFKISPYVSYDRQDTAFGGNVEYGYGLPWEFYIEAKGQYSSSNAPDFIDSRGIKLTNATFVEDSDPSTVSMPSLQWNDWYVKQAVKGEFSLSKVFNFSLYSYKIPLSLQRESLYGGYRLYNFEEFFWGKTQAQEVYCGATLSTLMFHKLALPVTVEYIHNNNELIAQRDYFTVSIGVGF